jgi:hypothetical protein
MFMLSQLQLLVQDFDVLEKNVTVWLTTRIKFLLTHSPYAWQQGSNRLQRWYAGDGSDVETLYSHTLQPSAHRGRITFHPWFRGTKRSSSHQLVRAASPLGIQCEAAENCLGMSSGDVRLRINAGEGDWKTHPYLCVARSCRWMLYRTEAEATKARVLSDTKLQQKMLQ